MTECIPDSISKGCEVDLYCETHGYLATIETGPCSFAMTLDCWRSHVEAREAREAQEAQPEFSGQLLTHLL